MDLRYMASSSLSPLCVASSTKLASKASRWAPSSSPSSSPESSSPERAASSSMKADLLFLRLFCWDVIQCFYSYVFQYFDIQLDVKLSQYLLS